MNVYMKTYTLLWKKFIYFWMGDNKVMHIVTCGYNFKCH